MNQQLRAWLASPDALRIVDSAVAAAAQVAFQQHAQQWTRYELDCSLGDIWRLSQDQDCCYDRPSIGPTYAMWYHGQRTHDAIRLIGRAVAESRDGVQILDVGAGTGTTLFAAALVIAGLVRTHQPHAGRVHLKLVDASPFMLEHARTGWGELQRTLPELQGLVFPDFECATWPKATPFAAGDCIVVGSYMFDHSDATRLAEITLAFRALLHRSRATELLLMSARPRREVAAGVAAALGRAGWTAQPGLLEPELWNGVLAQAHAVRSHLYTQANLPNPGRWQRQPPWNDFRDKVVFRFLGRETHPPIPAIPFAGQIDPDARQHEAATPDDRPTLVFGAAGSGKSIVLAERVVRVVEVWQQCQREQLINTGQNPPPRVLVTAFNRDMVVRLKQLVRSRLGDGWRETEHRSDAGFLPVTWSLSRDGQNQPDIRFANWDLVATRVLRFPANGRSNWAEQVPALLNGDEGALLPEYARNEAWLLSELRRVIWGRRALVRGIYCGDGRTEPIERRGRERPLQAQSRETVWRMLMDGRVRHWIHRLIDVHRAMTRTIADGVPWRNGGFNPFTHIFVDECQDFTPADFDIVASMSDEGSRLFATGDHAQSLRLGRSCPIPGLIRRRRWDRKELLGSYRVPLRICESVRPLAEFIAARDGVGEQDHERLAALPQSMKAATLGVRPVFVVGETRQHLATALADVLRTYGTIVAEATDPAQRRISIVEEDEQLRACLQPLMNGAALPIVSESMHSIKGLERSCVVWSTAAAFDTDESHEEWAYTILTRITCLLIVAMVPHETPEPIRRIVGRLHPQRVLHWTEEAEEQFNACHRLAQ